MPHPKRLDRVDQTVANSRWASRHHRATNDVSGVRLWYRDPNGTDVAIRLPIEADANNRPGQEIDPDHIITRLQAAAESTTLE